MGILKDINLAASRFLLPQDPKGTYTIIVEEAKKIVNATEGSIILWQNDKLERVYSSNPQLYKIKPRKNGRTHEAFILGSASFYHVKEIKEPHPILKRLRVKTVIYLPLSYESETIGVINMLCEDFLTFSEEKLNLLKLFGTLASLAIRKAQLLAETKNSLDNQKLYLSLASHEIKTPLTALYTFVQLLDSQSKRLNPSAEGLVKKIRSETVRINILVGEFLEGKNRDLDSSLYNWRVCDVNEIVSRAIDNFSIMFPSRKLILKKDDKSSTYLIWADFDKMLQVVDNILNNSGKYSDPTGKIIIEIKNLSNDIAIYIKDEGKGIGSSDIKNIFNKFYRSSNEKKNGLGLGLYLVNTILINHGGSIGVSSKEGSGSTFVVKIPKYIYD